MSAKASKYYAVAIGRRPGIYNTWYGPQGAQAQVHQFKGAIFKGFASPDAAKAFIQAHTQHTSEMPPVENPTPARPNMPVASPAQPIAPQTVQPDTPCNLPSDRGPRPEVTIFTDGGALRNPGPGGYGVIVKMGRKRQEFSGGFRYTTNNRMELTACIEGLACLKVPSRVRLYSDSKYVVNGIQKGWARRWRRNNWMRTPETPALNADLWEKLLQLCALHQVHLEWVKGHAGHAENERCDRLAVRAAQSNPQAIDTGYESD